jgi:murein hydrolase activator
MNRKRVIGGLRRLAASVALATACALTGAPQPAFAGEAASALEERRDETLGERERLLRRISISDERIATLSEEVAELRKDNATLSAALVEAAESERRLGNNVEAASRRLEELSGKEDYLRQSLRARRGVLAEVLGALQRMGRNPPPAILVRPDDALSSVRSAILLGAVVPELRAETEVLIADLAELAHVAASITDQRERLVAALTLQAEEVERMKLLSDEKRRLQLRSQTQLAREQERAAELAARAGSMEELIASLEAEIEAALQAEEEARQEELARREAEAAEADAETAEADPSDPDLKEPSQFAALPFSARQGQVRLPVQGRLAHRFGDDDEAGGRLAGDIVRTHSGRDRNIALRRVGPVCGALPFLWATLDPERWRWLSSGTGGNE